MLARRHFLSLAPFGTVLGRTVGDREAGTADITDQTMRDLVRAVEQIRTELQVQRTFTELDAVREPQKQFLKTSGKFPDFIDVGIDVWYRVYDWHMKWQQPPQLGRDASGRYTMMVMGTTLVMRPDALPNYVGIPYDNK
jgi:hypothetical protein